MDNRFETYARLAAIFLLIAGCMVILRPFLGAILFAGAVCISSWSLYLRLLRKVGGRNTVAAGIMTLSLILVVILPLALVAYNLADSVAGFYEQLKTALETGTIVPPEWLRSIPVVGESADRYMRELFGSREQMIELGRRMLEPARHLLTSSGVVLGKGVAQMSLAAFVAFFLFRDGIRLLGVLEVAMDRLIGASAAKVAAIISHTVRAVMYGLLGTALAQALVAALGFAIAGVPAVPLLAVGTFLFSLVPVGPPIIWGGATLWLFNEGRPGWAVFMALWGLFLISGVDNVVKPMLISRGSSLPFLLVLLGVLGGVLAFGFVGLFIGPTLLAVGYFLVSDWTAHK